MKRLLSPLWGGLITAAALCLAAPLSLELGPVPITLQSLIVCLAGALAGGAGVLGVLGWLSLAALGLPVLAGMRGGLLAMGGYSAGFIVALPLAARLAMRWQPSWNWRQTLLLVLGCHALLLALGGAFIALRGGDVATLAVLLPGAGVKAAVATLVLWLVGRRAA
ncbi:biotin transporter BioY [Sandarakinorhabdus sp.]|uniref:biotin transporter BioY n=1 Tax=Sandarakinorhabdus sp. TaxID=1916663 RepID=UPI00286DDA4B|nr:biotin transporter BioY [Sandarakinorhabdus sp.]